MAIHRLTYNLCNELSSFNFYVIRRHYPGDNCRTLIVTELPSSNFQVIYRQDVHELDDLCIIKHGERDCIVSSGEIAQHRGCTYTSSEIFRGFLVRTIDEATSHA